MGYHRAGFDVTGIDITPQPRYPFTFIQADAMTYPLGGFDVIHASPPCQGYTRSMQQLVTRQYARLIDPLRSQLAHLGVSSVIENVPGSPLPHQDTLDGPCGVELCGTMFGLRIRRHRLFEMSFPVAAPRGCNHSASVMNPYDAQWRRKQPDENTWRAWRAEMGIDWMDQRGGQEAIPPAYTEYIGRQLMDAIATAASRRTARRAG